VASGIVTGSGSTRTISIEGARAVAQAIAGDVARGTDPQARRKAERAQAARERLSTLRAFLDGRYEPWARAHLNLPAFSSPGFAATSPSNWSNLCTHSTHSWSRACGSAGGRRACCHVPSIAISNGCNPSLLAQWSGAFLTFTRLKGLKPMKADKTGRVRFLTAQEEASATQGARGSGEKLRQARIRFNTWRIARGRKPFT